MTCHQYHNVFYLLEQNVHGTANILMWVCCFVGEGYNSHECMQVYQDMTGVVAFVKKVDQCDYNYIEIRAPRGSVTTIAFSFLNLSDYFLSEFVQVGFHYGSYCFVKWTNNINMSTGRPICVQNPESLKDKVHEQVNVLLEDGLIEESVSPHACPVIVGLCVTKKDTSIRICADLRAVTSITVPDEYPASDTRNIWVSLYNWSFHQVK